MIKPAVISVFGKLYVLGNLDLFQTVKTCEDLQEQNNCRSLYCEGVFLGSGRIVVHCTLSSLKMTH